MDADNVLCPSIVSFLESPSITTDELNFGVFS